MFETVTNNQPNFKYVLSIPVKFCVIKPEPELVTKTITYENILYTIIIILTDYIRLLTAL